MAFGQNIHFSTVPGCFVPLASLLVSTIYVIVLERANFPSVDTTVNERVRSLSMDVTVQSERVYFLSLLTQILRTWSFHNRDRA